MRDWFDFNKGKLKQFLFENFSSFSIFRHEEIIQKLKFNYDYSVPLIESFFWSNKTKINLFFDELQGYNNIIVIIGRRRYGKTALMVWIAEVLHINGFRCAWVGERVPPDFPKWFEHYKDFEEVPQGYHCFSDEAHRRLFHRSFSSKDSKKETLELTISGHRNKSIYYSTQNSSLLDLDVFRLVDAIICKPFSLMQLTTERSILFENLELFLPKKKSETLFISHSNKFKFFNPLPNCWSNKISKYFQQ